MGSLAAGGDSHGWIPPGPSSPALTYRDFPCRRQLIPPEISASHFGQLRLRIQTRHRVHDVLSLAGLSGIAGARKDAY